MNPIRRLYDHYHAYHAYGPPRLKYMGLLGMLTFCAFYFLRFTRPNPQVLDDLELRTGVVLAMLALGLQDLWPARLKPYYIPFSYAAMVYSLPFFTVYTGLERGGGVPAISNGFISLCFLTLLTDWRNTFVMLGLGSGLAVALFRLTHPGVPIAADMVAQLPAYLVIAIGANLFKFSTEQIETERKLRATQALAGSIAHELRYPLARIRYSLESMQRVLPVPGVGGQVAPVAPAEVEALYRHLAQGEQAIDRGLQVISMTLEEVSAKPLDEAGFSYLSAAEVVQKAVDEYTYDSEEARGRVAVQVLGDFHFRGDETAFLFVLFNLLKNALYYLEPYPGTRVEITVGSHQVKVRDNGPGIAPDVLAGLFEPFRSVGKSGGTGLGLAYCQRVMKAFAGEIRCESRQGEFTEFTLRLPPIGEAERELHRLSVLEAARASLSGKRLLLVEDDAAQRVTTRHKLRPLGLQVDEAPDGQRALDLLARHAYDLVLLDLQMPVLDGYQVVQRVRQGEAPANRYVRIVAHTSEPVHVARVKTQRAGMDGFISKPCAQLPLALALQRALARRPSPAVDRPLRDRRLLLADDSPFNRRAVSAYLQEAGATVVEVEHGIAVLDELGSGQRFDAVLMDLSMPGLDGVEAARAIRGSGRPWARVPIVALTAHSDAPAIDAARSAGMDGFLVKPVDAGLLYDSLASVLAGTRALPLPEAQPPAAPPPVEGPLLNVARLESYQRLGLLDELLADYLPEIARLVEVLADAVQRQELDQARDALHSLLGMSGEAGAQALYHHVRRIYVPVLEQRSWPQDSGWLAQLRTLAGRTEQALRDYGARQDPARIA
ncbi:MAG TPA: response regulator [Ramlibacter sp.]|jgi:CheY-like chemotaxis protein|uniref:hybrid sensor histidine kinase/response regulator n=1 Tax=Ramlibacter sp. TaxID=1917967 RepID=UPI002D3031C1|nr:response regulator [Ramlibacter sp.]HZY18526.1 response regulator [Ramlibacter sp.]